jgi:uncharacterized protein
MREEHIYFNNGTDVLEGLYAVSAGTVGAVISHPHPLHGGDMRNSVVEILAATISNVGLATLRFNFRGVGKSGGAYDKGNGEKADVLAAISFMETKGIRDVITVGYSFGAWVNADVIPQNAILPAIFVSPPVDLFPFDLQTLRGRIGLIVSGDRDPFCPVERLKNVAGELNCRLEFISGADHFFRGEEDNLATCVGRYVLGAVS